MIPLEGVTVRSGTFFIPEAIFALTLGRVAWNNNPCRTTWEALFTRLQRLARLRAFFILKSIFALTLAGVRRHKTQWKTLRNISPSPVKGAGNLAGNPARCRRLHSWALHAVPTIEVPDPMFIRWKKHTSNRPGSRPRFYAYLVKSERLPVGERPAPKPGLNSEPKPASCIYQKHVAYLGGIELGKAVDPQIDPLCRAAEDRLSNKGVPHDRHARLIDQLVAKARDLLERHIETKGLSAANTLSGGPPPQQVNADKVTPLSIAPTNQEGLKT